MCIYIYSVHMYMRAKIIICSMSVWGWVHVCKCSYTCVWWYGSLSLLPCQRERALGAGSSTQRSQSTERAGLAEVEVHSLFNVSGDHFVFLACIACIPSPASSPLSLPLPLPHPASLSPSLPLPLPHPASLSLSPSLSPSLILPLSLPPSPPLSSCPGPSRRVMDQLRNLSDTGPPATAPSKAEGKGAVRVTHPESVFSLPTQSEEKIGVEVLGPLANLVKFNPESTEMVS